VTPDRSAILEQALNRLKEDAADVGVSEPLPMSQARKQTDDILGRMEFREVRQDNYLGRRSLRSSSCWTLCLVVPGAISPPELVRFPAGVDSSDPCVQQPADLGLARPQAATTGDRDGRQGDGWGLAKRI